ncbi:MAG: nucleotide exchange factor GrpE [Firmicutes bacterium]|nr:nucleotide exchange factor GrpE [Bacillota bacterium]
MNDNICLTVYEDDKLARVVVAKRGEVLDGKKLSKVFPAGEFIRVDGKDTNFTLMNVSKSKFKYVTKEEPDNVNFLIPMKDLSFDKEFTLIFFDDLKDKKDKKIPVIRIKTLNGDDNFFTGAKKRAFAMIAEENENDIQQSENDVKAATEQSMKIIAEATEKQKQIINEANNRAKEISDMAMSNSVVVQNQAQAKADEIIAAANKEAEEIKKKAAEESEKVKEETAKKDEKAKDEDNKDNDAKEDEAQSETNVNVLEEYEKLVREFRREESKDEESTAHIQMYEKARTIVDETSKDIRQQLNDTIKAVESLQNSLWNKPFSEFASRVREIDKLLDNKDMNKLSMEDDGIKRVYATISSVRKRIVKTLNSIGVEEYIPKKGEKFDPELHDDVELDSQGLDVTIEDCVDVGFKNSGGVLLKAVVKTIKQ